MRRTAAPPAAAPAVPVPFARAPLAEAALLVAAMLSGVAAAVLAGCTVGPGYRRPPVTQPAQFYGLAGQAEAAPRADLPRWELFQDPTLESLIEEALRHGSDIRIATPRLEEARAR